MLGLVNPRLAKDPVESTSTKDDESKKEGSLVDSIQAAAFSFGGKNLALVVPIYQQDENIITESMYQLKVSDVAFVLGYFRDNGGKMVGSWSTSKAAPDRAWSSEFEDYAFGLHARFNSNQSVSKISDKIDAAENELVRPFNINGAYHPQTAKMNMGAVELSFSEAKVLKQIADTATGVGRTAYQIYLDIASLHSSLALAETGVEETTPTSEEPSRQKSRREKQRPRLCLCRTYYRPLSW